jgi:hypothetical protein
MAGKDFSVAMEGPKKIVVVWAQESCHSVILVGGRGVGVYIATRVPERYVNTCSHPSGWGKPVSG